MSSSEILLLQAPIRVVVTLLSVTSWSDIRVADLPATGVLYTILTTMASVMAGFQYQDALRSGGSGATVAAIAGVYPALSYVLGVVMGAEELTRSKVLGVLFAAMSCYMFSI